MQENKGIDFKFYNGTIHCLGTYCGRLDNEDALRYFAEMRRFGNKSVDNCATLYYDRSKKEFIYIKKFDESLVSEDHFEYDLTQSFEKNMADAKESDEKYKVELSDDGYKGGESGIGSTDVSSDEYKGGGVK